MKGSNRLTPLEKSWILYDIGNSAFTLMISTLIPIYFNALASSAGLDETSYLAYWGYAGSIATLIVAFVGPVCGTLADHKGFKKPIFLLCVLLGVIGCALLGLPASWMAFLILFIVARVGYSAATVFYDAMLPEVTTDRKMDIVSTKGYAYGYIGSVIPFVICLVLVLGYEVIGIPQGTAMGIAFCLTAVWWILCTLPLLRRYRQTAFVETPRHPVAATFRQLGRTFKDVRKEKHIFLYLLSFFFFIDGVYTIIDMATAYGTALGLDTTGLLLALLVTQLVAFPFAILFGRLAARYNTGLLIKVCIIAYTGITVFAMFMMAQWQFWTLAVLVGVFQGGIQALSRSYLGKIIPPERSGEYFGIMDICGKGASFLGMMMVSIVSEMTRGMTFHVFGLELQNENLAVGTLVLNFILGYFFFHKADRLNREYIEK